VKAEIFAGRVPTEADVQLLASAITHGRYAEDATLGMEGVRDLLLHNLRALLASPEAVSILLRGSSGSVEGLVTFRLSRWDSEHFGFPCAVVDSVIVVSGNASRREEVARLLFAEYDRWTEGQEIRFTSMRLPSLDLPVVHAAEASHFRFMESWVFNTRATADEPAPSTSGGFLRLAVPADKDAMLRCSREAFAVQRFHADARFDREKADLLYRKWIDTAFADPDHKIAVWELDGGPRGFVAYYDLDLRNFLGRRFAMWRVVLLDSDYRGRGVGAEFFQALAVHHRREGADCIDSGVTLRNLHSLNLHNKSRFRLVSTLVTFHKWHKT